MVAAPGKTETERPRRAEEERPERPRGAEQERPERPRRAEQERPCYLALRVQRADGAPDTPGQGDSLGLSVRGEQSRNGRATRLCVYREQTALQTHRVRVIP